MLARVFASISKFLRRHPLQSAVWFLRDPEIVVCSFRVPEIARKEGSLARSEMRTYENEIVLELFQLGGILHSLSGDFFFFAVF